MRWNFGPCSNQNQQAFAVGPVGHLADRGNQHADWGHSSGTMPNQTVAAAAAAAVLFAVVLGHGRGFGFVTDLPSREETLIK